MANDDAYDGKTLLWIEKVRHPTIENKWTNIEEVVTDDETKGETYQELTDTIEITKSVNTYNDAPDIDNLHFSINDSYTDDEINKTNSLIDDIIIQDNDDLSLSYEYLGLNIDDSFNWLINGSSSQQSGTYTYNIEGENNNSLRILPKNIINTLSVRPCDYFTTGDIGLSIKDNKAHCFNFIERINNTEIEYESITEKSGLVQENGILYGWTDQDETAITKYNNLIKTSWDIYPTTFTEEYDCYIEVSQDHDGEGLLCIYVDGQQDQEYLIEDSDFFCTNFDTNFLEPEININEQPNNHIFNSGFYAQDEQNNVFAIYIDEVSSLWIFDDSSDQYILLPEGQYYLTNALSFCKYKTNIENHQTNFNFIPSKYVNGIIDKTIIDQTKVGTAAIIDSSYIVKDDFRYSIVTSELDAFSYKINLLDQDFIEYCNFYIKPNGDIYIKLNINSLIKWKNIINMTATNMIQIKTLTRIKYYLNYYKIHDIKAQTGWIVGYDTTSLEHQNYKIKIGWVDENLQYHHLDDWDMSYGSNNPFIIDYNYYYDGNNDKWTSSLLIESDFYNNNNLNNYIRPKLWLISYDPMNIYKIIDDNDNNETSYLILDNYMSFNETFKNEWIKLYNKFLLNYSFNLNYQYKLYDTVLNNKIRYYNGNNELINKGNKNAFIYLKDGEFFESNIIDNSDNLNDLELLSMGENNNIDNIPISNGTTLTIKYNDTININELQEIAFGSGNHGDNVVLVIENNEEEDGDG